MAKLRKANMKHSQYATSIGHLQHIYEINEIIEKTREYIQDGKLLLAHKKLIGPTLLFFFFFHSKTLSLLLNTMVEAKVNLIFYSIMEMEHARDDLMYEVHKLQQDNVNYEKNACFCCENSCFYHGNTSLPFSPNLEQKALCWHDFSRLKNGKILMV